MAQTGSDPPPAERRRWPEETRRRALVLATECANRPVDVRRRLSAEGVDVPAETVRHWLRSKVSQPADLPTLRERINRLASRELAKLEASSPGKVDLRRLEALSRILKTAETERPNRQQAKGLARFAELGASDDSDADLSGAFDVKPSASREP